MAVLLVILAARFLLEVSNEHINPCIRFNESLAVIIVFGQQVIFFDLLRQDFEVLPTLNTP